MAQMAGLRLATPSGSIPSSASEATKQLLQSKKLSKKFNYDVLDSLLESQSVSFLADYIDREASKSLLAT
jgi:Brf1-like TBP-binding domain